MWQQLWPDRQLDEVPIGYVTNGAHFPTWVGAPMRALLDRHLGARTGSTAQPTATCGRPSTRSPTTSCGRCASASAPSS